MLDALVLFCFLAQASLDKRNPAALQQQCALPPPVYTDFRLRQILQLFVSSPGTAPEDDNSAEAHLPTAPPVRREWYYPSFESIVDTIESHITKDRSSMKPGPNTMVYTLEEGFLPQDRSWMDHVRVDRMGRNAKVLYRPEIVNDLVQRIDELLESGDRFGLMVRGPQGIGKSYSLINLTRYLLTSGKYWVTIIPNCEDWRDADDFLKFLLNSVGVDPAHFLLDHDVTRVTRLKALIHDIDKILSKHGMQWVFVFDQINRIFARYDDSGLVSDIGVLPMPFPMMNRVMKRGRIISIVSASASNPVWYKENHKGFDVFDHPTRLDKDEIKMLYSPTEMAQWDWDTVEYATGRVPWYLSRWAKDPEHFAGDIRNEIQFSLNKLRVENERDMIWTKFVESAVQCVQHKPLYRRPLFWDRKYSYVQEEKGRSGYMYTVAALFPLVDDTYRDFFRDEIAESNPKQYS